MTHPFFQVSFIILFRSNHDTHFDFQVRFDYFMISLKCNLHFSICECAIKSLRFIYVDGFIGSLYFSVVDQFSIQGIHQNLFSCFSHTWAASNLRLLKVKLLPPSYSVHLCTNIFCLIYFGISPQDTESQLGQSGEGCILNLLEIAKLSLKFYNVFFYSHWQCNSELKLLHIISNILFCQLSF